MKKAIILLSGGLDSATCGVIARDMGFEIYALSFSYGQRNAFELDAARGVALFLGAREHRVINIDLAAFGGSALFASSGVDVPKGDKAGGGGASGIPPTYVPARNTIFLSYALAWAEVLGMGQGADLCCDIFIGVNNVDYSGYPDCRPEYIAAFEKMANLATVAGVGGHKTTIHTPLMSLSKAEIIKIGVKAGLDYGMTRTCYDPDSQNGGACGVCDSCQIRKKGFEQAGVADPTAYFYG
ncbi:MAG: 7-cyano-7-deazaguanine synthase QueC [Chitinispirillales bacterium]|jgi:7-cyano-7-deazaguanine synthase|nr:7-cyano-7-deazaguanine synthase QueC [Chitinispirillales bacterium]